MVMNAQAPKNIILKFDEDRILRELQRDESALEHYRAVAIVKGLMEIVVIWVKDGMEETPEEMAEMMFKIFFIEN